MKTSYTLKGRITEDHRLEVDLPADVPAGEAQVTLEPTVEPEPNGRALLALLKELDRQPQTWPRRTTAEVDAELNAMRDEWDAR